MNHIDKTTLTTLFRNLKI